MKYDCPECGEPLLIDKYNSLYCESCHFSEYLDGDITDEPRLNIRDISYEQDFYEVDYDSIRS